MLVYQRVPLLRLSEFMGYHWNPTDWKNHVPNVQTAIVVDHHCTILEFAIIHGA